MKKNSSKLLVGLLSLSMIFTGGILPFGLSSLDSYAETQQNLTNFKVKIKLVDAETGQVITENKPAVTVEYDDDDDMTETVNPVDGVYDVNKYTDYDITVTGNEAYEGYVKRGEKFSGTEENITYEIKLYKKTPVSEAVNAAKAKIESVYTAHKIGYEKDYTIQDYLKDYIKNANIAGSENINYEVVETEDETVIDKAGKIHYVDPNVEKLSKDSWAKYFKNITCKIKISDTEGRTFTKPLKFMVGWDLSKVEDLIKNEAHNFNKESIKGENASLDAVESPLNLPTITGTDMRDSWADIDWEASPTGILEITDKDQSKPLEGKRATVKKKPAQDTEVTLIGTFKVNDTPLNPNLDDPKKVSPAQVSIKVNVKGTGAPAATEQDLKDLLDKYYKPVLQENIKKSTVEENGVLENIQLPRYTQIKDGKNKLVFENKEITVTSSDDKLAKVNGYNLIVDPLYDEKDVTLTVTFKRGQLTVTQDYPIKLGTYPEDVFTREKQLMDYAKAHYFDGIKGENSDADHIKSDLRTFNAITLDSEGNPTWIRELPKVPNVDAVVVDDFFDDSFVAETNGYNKFKSSDHEVIEKEALRVHRQPTSKKVEVSSLLTSARFKYVAKNHLDDPKIAALYKQEVKADVKVLGTQPAKPELKKLIDEVTAFENSMVEGDGPGKFKEGAKAALKTAIGEAQAVYDKTDATETDVEGQIDALNAALEAAKDKQNPIKVSSSLVIALDKDTVKTFNKLEVYSDTAAKFGYEKPAAYKNKVTTADVFAKVHEELFGADFKANPKNYFDYNGKGYITKFYGKDAKYTGYYVNNAMPLYPGTDKGSVVNDTIIQNGDSIRFFFYQDTKKWSDYYTYLDKNNYQEDAGKDFVVTLKDFTYGNPSKPAEGIKLAIVSDSGEVVAEAVTNNEGKATFNISKPGEYIIKPVAGSEAHRVVVPFAETVKITGAEQGTGSTTGGSTGGATTGTIGSTTTPAEIVLKDKFVKGEPRTTVEVKGDITSKDNKKVELVINDFSVDINKMKPVYEVASKVAKEMKADLEIVGAYEVHLTDNAKINGKLKVKLPVATNLKNVKVTVIHIKNEKTGQYETFKNLPIKDGFVEVEVESLSPFIVALENARGNAGTIGVSDGTNSDKANTGLAGKAENGSNQVNNSQKSNHANTGDSADLIMYLFALSVVSVIAAALIRRKISR